MPLLGGPISAEASQAVEALLADIVVPSRPQPLRPSSLQKYRVALGALLSDLLRFQGTGAGGKHAMSPQHFPSSEIGFGRTIFVPIKTALVTHGLIEFANGWNHTGEGFSPGSVVRWGGDVAFFRPTGLLVERLGSAASDPWHHHWRAGKPSVPQDVPRLVLRARKLRGRDTGEDMPFEPQEPLAALWLADLEEANSYLASKNIEGIAFSGLRRIFNDGDQPGKRWKRGGRYYSLAGGDAYEMMNGETRRSLIRFDGEAAAEVDIAASHLTVLYAIHGQPFDATKGDPYEVAGIHREAVKAFVTIALGRAAAEGNRWSPRAREKYAEQRPGRNLSSDYRFSDVRAAVIQKHPILHELAEDDIIALDLQWHESEILRIAMANLRRDKDIPSLPVHDSLVVPASKTEVAEHELRWAFKAHFESETVAPKFSVKGLALAEGE